MGRQPPNFDGRDVRLEVEKEEEEEEKCMTNAVIRALIVKPLMCTKVWTFDRRPPRISYQLYSVDLVPSSTRHHYPLMSLCSSCSIRRPRMVLTMVVIQGHRDQVPYRWIRIELKFKECLGSHQCRIFCSV